MLGGLKDPAKVLLGTGWCGGPQSWDPKFPSPAASSVRGDGGSALCPEKGSPRARLRHTSSPAHSASPIRRSDWGPETSMEWMTLSSAKPPSHPSHTSRPDLVLWVDAIGVRRINGQEK